MPKLQSLPRTGLLHADHQDKLMTSAAFRKRTERVSQEINAAMEKARRDIVVKVRSENPDMIIEESGNTFISASGPIFFPY